MDGFSGYNQIKMAPEDRENTTFITPWETFFYRGMPFDLKNAGATYQNEYQKCTCWDSSGVYISSNDGITSTNAQHVPLH